MSRPGYPKTQNQYLTVNNSYYIDYTKETINGTSIHFLGRTYEDKVGANTPGWPHVVRTNSYVRSRFTVNNSIMSSDFTNRNNHDRSYGDWGTYRCDADYDPWGDTDRWATTREIESVKSKLVNKLIQQIQSNRVNLGEIMHTRHQTADLVASTCNRLAGAFTSLRRGNFAGATRQLLGSKFSSSSVKRAVGGIPEQWLQLKYGWQPLVQDIYNSVQTVKRAYSDQACLFTVNASAREECDQVQVTFPGLDVFAPSRTWKSTSGSVSGKAQIKFTVDDENASAVSQLGITNPASLAWELLPYSFVVDWFYPVGTFLEALDYSLGLRMLSGWLSYTARREATAELGNTTKTDVGPGWDGRWSGGSGHASAFLFVREALTEFPGPPIPRLKDPFSLTHVANGLSLLATAFGR